MPSARDVNGVNSQFSITKALLLLLLVLLPFFATAQEIIPPEVDYPYRRDIEKLRYDKAEEKVLRHLSRDSNDIPCRYAAFYLYSDKANPNKNLRLAYRHLVSLRSLYRATDAKDALRLERDNISAARIDYDLRQLALQAQADARTTATIDAFDAFLSTYLLAPSDIRESVIFSRDSIEYRHACTIGSFDDIQDFINRRPNSAWLPQAISRRDSLAFDEADRRHITSAYEAFRTAYPNSALVSRATDSIYLLDYRDVRQLDAEQYYRGYALRYPQSPYTPRTLWRADSLEFHRLIDTSDWRSFIRYLDIHDCSPVSSRDYKAPSDARPGSQLNPLWWPNKALDLLARSALRSSSLQALREAAARLPRSHQSLPAIALRLRDAYLHTSITNFDKFYTAYPDLLPDSIQNTDAAAYALYRQYKANPQSATADSCIRLLAPCHEAFVLLQQQIKEHIDKGRWSDALELAEGYADLFADDGDFRSLCATLAAPIDPAFKSNTLGAPLNSLKGDEHSPVLSHDGSTLYFAAEHRPENIGGTDLFVSRRNGKMWSTPAPMTELCHALGNESPLSVSPDQQTLLLSLDGNTYFAQQDTDGWRIDPITDIIGNSAKGLKDQPAAINYRTLSGTLNAANRCLVFSARSITEREADSSLNLFVMYKLLDDTWSQPIELGPAVNTPFNECAPYLHADMHTLFFASDGHGALGDMDIFVTTRLDDDRWDLWSAPVNLGKGINTSGTDRDITLSADGSQALITHRGSQSQDIYTVSLPHAAKPQQLILVRGNVRNSSGQPVATTVRWERTPIQKDQPLLAPHLEIPMGECRTNPRDGSFHFYLPANQQYCCYVSDSLYYPEAAIIDPAESNAPQLSLSVTSYEQFCQQSEPIVLKTISYKVSDYQFRETSENELNRLANIIYSQRLSVEIGSHVDGNPGDLDSQTLTQHRAEVIRNYLIKLGCDPDRITAVGYGTSRPFSDSHSAQNKIGGRRIEIKCLPSY